MVTGPTVSVAVQPAYETRAPAADVASKVWVGGAVSVGAVVSRTMTSNVPFVKLPERSVAVQITTVSPSANVAPDACVYVMLTGETVSVAVQAGYVTVAPLGDVASA